MADPVRDIGPSRVQQSHVHARRGRERGFPELRRSRPAPSAARALHPDVAAVAAGVALVVLAAVVGGLSYAGGGETYLGWPPLLAQWLPHVGPGSVAAAQAGLALVVNHLLLTVW